MGDRSLGHLFDYQGREYFEAGGAIWHAPLNADLDTDRRRLGARFECWREHLPLLKILLGVDQEESHEAQTEERPSPGDD